MCKAAGFYALTGSHAPGCQIEVKQKSASRSLESCFFSRRTFQHAIKDAEHTVYVVLIWGQDFSFMVGRGVPWEGAALRRTRLKTEGWDKEWELPVLSDAWPRPRPALEPWNSSRAERALGEHHNLWFPDCVFRSPGVQGEAEQLCCTKPTGCVKQGHQNNTWEN